jgi:hypothetical protein
MKFLFGSILLGVQFLLCNAAINSAVINEEKFET